MLKIWELFPDLVATIKKSHEDAGLAGGHHDIYHACRVGNISYRIAHDEWGDQDLARFAGIAGLCHNADRIVEERPGDLREKAVLVRTWLGPLGLPQAAKDLIMSAVMGHTGRNQSSDHPALIALMDADRVVNLDNDLWPRSGQLYHDLLVVDMVHFIADPEATYRNPKTVLRDITYSLEWLDPTSPFCMRTRLGKLLGGQRGVVFKMLIDTLKFQLEDEGVLGLQL